MSDNKNLNTNEQDGIEVGGSNEAEAVTPDEITVSAMAQDKALTRSEIDELYAILKQAEEGQK